MEKFEICFNCKYFYAWSHKYSKDNKDGYCCFAVPVGDGSRPATRNHFTCNEWKVNTTELMKQYPALKDAWEHYESILILINKGEYDDRSE